MFSHTYTHAEIQSHRHALTHWHWVANTYTHRRLNGVQCGKDEFGMRKIQWEKNENLHTYTHIHTCTHIHTHTADAHTVSFTLGHRSGNLWEWEIKTNFGYINSGVASSKNLCFITVDAIRCDIQRYYFLPKHNKLSAATNVVVMWMRSDIEDMPWNAMNPRWIRCEMMYVARWLRCIMHLRHWQCDFFANWSL